LLGMNTEYRERASECGACYDAGYEHGKHDGEVEGYRQGREAEKEYQEDAFNAAMDYLELEGIRDPEKYITKPEEIAKKALTQMNQQLQQGQKQLEEMQRQGERQHRKLLHMQDTLKTTGMKVQQKFKGPEKETTIKIGEGRG